jgi:hypothetical protein
MKILEEGWNAIPLSTLCNLVDSLPTRCQEVICAKGYSIDQ